MCADQHYAVGCCWLSIRTQLFLIIFKYAKHTQFLQLAKLFTEYAQLFAKQFAELYAKSAKYFFQLVKRLTQFAYC